MPHIDHLRPEGYRRIPWKNGRGEVVVIACEDGGGWPNVDWHFGRTAIIEEGPFSDYVGYERLQVVIRGSGLVLVAPDHEIDLRSPLMPRRYDGGTPIRTRLEAGPVEVVNLIAKRARFEIDLRVADAGAPASCSPGRHVVHTAVGAAQVAIVGRSYSLGEDHALRIQTGSDLKVAVQDGLVLIGSIHDRR